MTRDTLVSILESEGFKSGAKGFAVPEEREAVCFISAPGEVIQISRVTKIEAAPASVALETTKGERFHFAYETVVGLRLNTAAAAKDRSPGFVR